MDGNDLSDDELDRLVLQASKRDDYVRSSDKPWEFALLEAVPMETVFSNGELEQWENLILTCLARRPTGSQMDSDLLTNVQHLPPSVPSGELSTCSPTLQLFSKLFADELIALDIQASAVCITDRGKEKLGLP